MLDGKKIDNKKYYTGVTTDYLLNGGDDFFDFLLYYSVRDRKKRG